MGDDNTSQSYSYLICCSVFVYLACNTVILFARQSHSAKNQKTSVSPSRSRQQSISSVYESVTGGSQDVIVERAKQVPY